MKLKNLFAGIFVALFMFSISVEAQKSKDKETMVKISTEFGDMTFKLYNDTPLHRDNFIKLAKEGFYDGTLFHRVIWGFMMQGGDPNSKTAKPGDALGFGELGYTVPAEILPHHFHKKGALAAARLPNETNPDKNSSASQFYVVHGYRHNDAQLDNTQNGREEMYNKGNVRTWYKVRGGTPTLDNEYTVFGEIIEGMEVIDLICNLEVNQGNRPKYDVAMKVTILD